MKKILTALLLGCSTTIFAQTSLPAFWDFTTPGISTPPTGWTLNQGTNGNLTYTGSQNAVGDVTACRLDATGEYAQIFFADKAAQLSYWMRGTGISPNPSFTGTFTVQESVDGSSWTALRTFTTASPVPGSMTRYVDQVSATAKYIRFFYTDKLSGSNVSLDSVLLKPAPAAPNASINIKQGSTTVVNNSTFIIGTKDSTIFTIENKGTGNDLNITGNTISGDAPTDFAFSGMPSVVPANSSVNFTLVFTPGASGSRLATMNISSNDSTKSPYVINLYGIGSSYASEPTAQPINLSFGNVRAWTYNVMFKPASPKPEQYLVLVRKDAAVSDVPVDGQTYKRGDRIGSSMVTYIGPDSFFVPRGIEANTSYHFAAFALNGPATFENYLTTSPLTGNVTTAGSNVGSYYAGVNAGSTTFVTDLHNKINPHDTVFYSSYTSTIINNFYAKDTTGGKKVVYCRYTNLPYVYDEPFVYWTGAGSGVLTREHTYAHSWMPSNPANNPVERPEYNDQHHLFPTNQTLANDERSNNPFGEVVTVTTQYGEGKLGKDINGKTVYEPRNAHKGDAARALMYMATCYHGVQGRNWSLPANQDQAVIKKWHQQDPPDAHEIARHEYVASIQHNRNPFIDSVAWANRIDFSNMSYILTPFPSLAITSPVGSETWYNNDNVQRNITWNSTLVDSVKIDLLIQDTVFTTLTNGVPASAGTFGWTIPLTTPVTGNAKIRISDTKSSLTATSAAAFNISMFIGIKEDALNRELKVYPNPSTGLVTIETGNLEDASAQLLDVTGREAGVFALTGTTRISIGERGVYILKITVGGNAVYRKIVVE